MSDEPEKKEPRERPEPADASLAAKITGDRDRRERARREPVGNLWRRVARVGTLGWVAVLPIVVGALLGRLLDRHLGTGVTWALAGMILGVAIASYTLWRLLAGELHE